MSESPSSPLLGSTSKHTVSKHSPNSEGSNEHTPLLSHSSFSPRYNDAWDQERSLNQSASQAAKPLRSTQSSDKATRSELRWPTIAAIVALGFVVIFILFGAFFTPAVVEAYAKDALIIEPTKLSIDSFTETGVRARVQAIFKMDASRVKNKNVRSFGRFGTWLAKEVESQLSKVEVYLPEYDNVLVGTAIVPNFVVDIRNGHTTAVDFMTDLEPGDADGIRRVANDWLEGRLDQIHVLGKADIALKSGLFSLGSQSIWASRTFQGDKLPAVPSHNVERLNFREVPVSIDGQRGMAADVLVSIMNSYPIEIDVPALGFDVLVAGCSADDPYIRLADATTGIINVEPRSDVLFEIGGIVRELPKPLLQTCPGSKSSPLDVLLGDYIHGNSTTLFVRGSNSPSVDTPNWISELISSITFPFPFPGHTFDGLIRNFSLTNTQFSLPDPFAEPESDDADPHISGDMAVIVGIPKEMNFGIDVSRLRATAEVFYQGEKLGDLNLYKWQESQSKRLDQFEGEDPALRIRSQIKNAPLSITNTEVFAELVQAIMFGRSTISLKIQALVDIEMLTVLGALIIKDLPAEGIVPVKR